MQCPVCKAENTQGPLCRRCKADLALLWALEDQRRAALTETKQCLVAGRWTEAIEHAEACDWMRSDPESRRLIAVAHLLHRDFCRAWQCYQRVQPASR